MRLILVKSATVCFLMVGVEGFEPSPGGLKVRCAEPLTLHSRYCGSVLIYRANPEPNYGTQSDTIAYLVS